MYCIKNLKVGVKIRKIINNNNNITHLSLIITGNQIMGIKRRGIILRIPNR